MTNGLVAHISVRRLDAEDRGYEERHLALRGKVSESLLFTSMKSEFLGASVGKWQARKRMGNAWVEEAATGGTASRCPLENLGLHTPWRIPTSSFVRVFRTQGTYTRVWDISIGLFIVIHVPQSTSPNLPLSILIDFSSNSFEWVAPGTMPMNLAAFLFSYRILLVGKLIVSYFKKRMQPIKGALDMKWLSANE